MKKVIKPTTVLSKFLAMQAIGDTVDVPWQVGRVFNTKKIYISPDSIGLNDEGDYVSLEETRKAVEFFANQLGGAVLWSEE